MAQFCTACGSEVQADSVFCHRCGHRLAAPKIPHLAEHASSATGPPSSDAIEPAQAAAVAIDRGDRGEDPERQLWTGGYSHRAMIPTWAAALAMTLLASAGAIAWWRVPSGLFLALVITVVILGGTGLLLAYRRLSVHYELTNQRFVHQTGLLRRVSDRIEVIDIDDVAYGQGPMERLLGVGTIKIISSDRSHPELLLAGIENVREVAMQIDDARRGERRRRGLYIEAV